MASDELPSPPSSPRLQARDRSRGAMAMKDDRFAFSGAEGDVREGSTSKKRKVSISHTDHARPRSKDRPADDSITKSK